MKMQIKIRTLRNGTLVYYIKEKRWYGWKTIQKFYSKTDFQNALSFIEKSTNNTNSNSSNEH